jgi:hypothetical protein
MPAEAAAIVETPAAAAPPPPPGSGPQAAGGADDFSEVDPIFAALSQHNPEESEAEATPEGEPGEKTEPEAKPEPDKEKTPEGEKPDAKAKRKELEREVFSDKALATPEGIKKARSYVEKRQAKLDGIGQRVAEERAQVASERAIFAEAVQQARAEIEPQQHLARKVAANLAKLDNPSSIEEFIGALGAMSSRPDADPEAVMARGIEIWEHGAKFMVGGGKRAQPSREVEELRSHVQRLERSLSERDTRNEEAQIEEETARAKQFVERRTTEIVTAAKDPTKFPELAKSIRLGLGENVVAEVAGMKRAAKAKGQRLGDSEALAIIEGELKKLTASEARAPASPAEASSAEARVSSIAPSMTRSAGNVRDKSEVELAEDLAKDTAALSFMLGTNIG